ncbi:MAG: hypothetical protein ACKO3N_04025 [Verrucomicrobiota bacterium]
MSDPTGQDGGVTGSLMPHPAQPGQVCLTREMTPPVYRLPDGLGLGVRVRTVQHDHGFWLVVEVDRPGTTWWVYVVLLEVVPRSRA